MKVKIVLLLILALTLFGASASWGVQATADVKLGATVTTSAILTLSTTSITFPDADPDTVKSIAAKENGALVTAKVKAGSTTGATLKVLATDDLKSGSDVIPIANVTSTATNASGSFFSAGPIAWSKTAPGVTVGEGKSGSYSGTFSWFLANDWSYATGSYTTSATYTLLVP